MEFYLDTRLIDAVLRAWDRADPDFSAVYAMDIFQNLRKRAEDFQQRTLTDAEYLDFLLHIDGIDMRAHRTEIERNLALIRSVDMEALLQRVNSFLPASAAGDARSLPVHVVIGLAGLAGEDYVVLDPSPCPWFPADGSDAEAYLEKFVKPVLRHEMHHVGYYRAHAAAPGDTPADVRQLAVDFIRQMQMEGGAILCEGGAELHLLSPEEEKRLEAGLARYLPILQEWRERADAEITEADWNQYYSLWEDDKPVYWMGVLMCCRLAASGRAGSVADCMAMQPDEFFAAAQNVR